MEKEHKWFDPDTNEEYGKNIDNYMYFSYVDTCKKMNIIPKCTLNDFGKIIAELENSSYSFKERAEIENEKDPTLQYVLEEDKDGELIILEIHFKEKGEFDISLMAFMDKNNE
jgi:hypothetical protein